MFHTNAPFRGDGGGLFACVGRLGLEASKGLGTEPTEMEIPPFASQSKRRIRSAGGCEEQSKQKNQRGKADDPDDVVILA